MKGLLTAAAVISAALFATGCAKNIATGPNEANKRYLDAWLQVNNVNVSPTGLGIYILEDTDGTGVEVEKDGFVLLDYTITDLEGNISSYTSAATAQQLGKYSESDYYGPKFNNTFSGNIYAGVAEMLIGMKAGGHRKAIIPGWLMSYDEFDNESDYLAQASTQSTVVYEVDVKDFTKDISKWEIDSIGRFFSSDVLIDGIPAKQLFTTASGNVMTAADSVDTGFYYKQLSAPSDTTSFPIDTTIFINYTGMTLDGRVFDTTIEDVAKDYGIYSSGRTYEPVQINWPSAEEDYTSITMGTGETSLINGFNLTLWQMKANEEGIGVFYSALGYANSGSGNSIPSYSPLIFKIEIVAKPED